MTAEERVVRMYPTVIRDGKRVVQVPGSSDIVKAIQEAEAAMKSRCEAEAVAESRWARERGSDAAGCCCENVAARIRALE